MEAADQRLKRIWQSMMGSGSVSKKFKSFTLFRAWAKENGFSHDTELVKIDPDGPFSEENCTFGSWEKADTNIVQQNMAGWDRMVDKIRQQCNLPPIMTSSPCIGCPSEERCSRTDTVCKTRLRYWDAMTERIKTGGKQYG